MLRLELTSEQAELLREVLDHALSDLRMEIADTDRLDFRRHLKEQKQVLVEVLEAIRKPAMALS